MRCETTARIKLPHRSRWRSFLNIGYVPGGGTGLSGVDSVGGWRWDCRGCRLCFGGGRGGFKPANLAGLVVWERAPSTKIAPLPKMNPTKTKAQASIVSFVQVKRRPGRPRNVSRATGKAGGRKKKPAAQLRKEAAAAATAIATTKVSVTRSYGPFPLLSLFCPSASTAANLTHPTTLHCDPRPR